MAVACLAAPSLGCGALVVEHSSRHIRSVPLGNSLGVAALAKCAEGDPRNHRQAMIDDSDGWSKAESIEFDNHVNNKSFEIVNYRDKPTDRKLVNFTWVYKRKRDGRMKARLCVQGCSMVHGVDYDQTFCATMRGGSLRLLAAVAASNGLRMRRWDFVAAYLQGALLDGETVYCRPPPGMEERFKGQVFKVIKPIYGMAQAGRRWQRTLFPWMKEHGFTQMEQDPCVFVKRDGADVLIVGCYVDDLFVLHSTDKPGSLYPTFIKSLQKDFSVEDEGEISDLLSIQIERQSDGVFLHQRPYIERMVATYFPDGPPSRYQARQAPCGPELPQLVADALLLDPSTDIPSVRAYQSIVGALLYCATNTRPDVAYAVGMLCRCMARPTPALYDAAGRVLCYLYHHRHIGLYYQDDPEPLHGMSDSDWAVKHSTTGWLYKYMRAAISWASTKQPTIALSTCEAEIMALSDASKEAVHLGRFIAELGYAPAEDPVLLRTDNTGALALSYNPENHAKVKHIDRRHFWVRELVEEFKVTVRFVATVDNLADFFTKPLAPSQFYAMRDKIMNVTPDIARRAARATRATGHARWVTGVGGC